MDVLVLYNTPTLAADDPDSASESGVLESVAAIQSALVEAGHRVRWLETGGSAERLLGLLASISRPDVVVNLCEGFQGRSVGEPYVAGVLDLLALPYTGSSPECLALARDKPRSKWLLRGAAISTPRFFLLRADEGLPSETTKRMLSLRPLIVKPAGEDASVGIGPKSVVEEPSTLIRQIKSMRKRYGDVIIEQYIDGREFNVGIVGWPKPKVLPLAEIEFAADPALPWPILTYEAKWSADSGPARATPVRCPAEIEPNLAERIREAALSAYQAIGCRDYGRVDLRVNAGGTVFVLEVNANPDLGPSAGLARAVQAAGRSYVEFISKLVSRAAKRSGADAKSKPRVTSDDLIEEGEAEVPPPAEAVPAVVKVPEVSQDGDAINIRDYDAADRPLLVEMVRSCGSFRDDEVAVADEVLGDAAKGQDGCTYKVLVAENDGRPVGWSCHGLVPLTDATFDLYWIAVDPKTQGKGVGRKLLQAVEARLRADKGRWLVAETSTSEAYESARAFYLRTGFAEVGRVTDFYRDGDGRVTYARRVAPGS